MKIQLLDWDTKYFCFKTGVYNIDQRKDFSLEQLELDAQKEGYRLVYLKSQQPLNNTSLFADERLVYFKNREARPSTFYSEIESYKSVTIEPEVYELALKSGDFSRYKLDKQFPYEGFQQLYQKWIENSVFTDYATDVLVYRIDNKPVGLLTYRNDGDTSNIGIIAVNQDYQSAGIGSKLIKHYQSILGNEIKYLDVVTQGVNKTARFFYEKNGYNIKSSSFVYHLWI